jgi:hypothetical protein
MENLSRFEQLLGSDIDAFYVMVDGALKDWPGVHDVLLPDVSRYLLKAKDTDTFGPVCRHIRSLAEGEQLCFECDMANAVKSATEGSYWKYSCHAGLLDVAVPLIVGGKLVAAILFGQTRPKSPEWDALARDDLV